jgi:hypothetical protein
MRKLETQRGRTATKNIHHGDTEKTQSESQNQNLNTEDTEKLRGRGGLKKLGMQA